MDDGEDIHIRSTPWMMVKIFTPLLSDDEDIHLTPRKMVRIFIPHHG
jgi:hypothetical protein